MILLISSLGLQTICTPDSVQSRAVSGLFQLLSRISSTSILGCFLIETFFSHSPALSILLAISKDPCSYYVLLTSADPRYHHYFVPSTSTQPAFRAKGYTHSILYTPCSVYMPPYMLYTEYNYSEHTPGISATPVGHHNVT